MRPSNDNRRLETILRSRVTRWAADCANSELATAADLVAFMERQPDSCRKTSGVSIRY